MTKRPLPTAGKPTTPPHTPQPPATAQADPPHRHLKTLRCRTVAQGKFHQLNYIRHLTPHPVTDAAPESLLAESAAPNASEALLAALGSCLAAGIHATALARHIAVHSLELEVEGDLDTTAGWGTLETNPGPLGFEVITVKVHLVADAPPEVIRALIKHVTLWSPVANTLHNPVHLDVGLSERTV